MKKTQILVTLLSCFSLLVAAYALTADATPAKQGETITLSSSAVTRVYDGDTFFVKLDNVPQVLQNIGVRVRGIDTPEMHSACGTKSAREAERQLAIAAQSMLRGQLKAATTVELVNVGRDKYFRLLADVRVDGKDVTTAMLAQKVAVPYFGGRKAGWCEL